MAALHLSAVAQRTCLAPARSSDPASKRPIACAPASSPCARHGPLSVAAAPSAARPRSLRPDQSRRRQHARRLVGRATPGDEGAIARRLEEAAEGEESIRGAGEGARGEAAGDIGGNDALTAETGVNSADRLGGGNGATAVASETAELTASPTSSSSSPAWWSALWGAGGWQKRWSIVVLCFFAFLLCNMDRVNMSIAVLPMAEQFQWTPATVGLVQSSFFWGYLLTQVAGGVWADTIGGKQVLGFGVVWWSLATVLTPIAAGLGLPALLFARACMGVGEGVAMPAMNNLLSKWVPVGERSRSLALVYSGMYLGSVAGLSLSPAIIHALGWPSVFFSFGALGLVWFAVWQGKAHSSPAEDPSVSAAERALIAGGGSGARGGEGEGKAGGVHLEGGEPLRLSTIPWRLLLSKAPVWAIIVCHFCHNWGVFILLTWMPTYYHDVLGFNLTESGLFAVLPWLTMALASNVGGWIADTLIARGFSVTLVRKVMQSIGFLGPAICLSLLSTVKSPVAAIALLMLSQGTDAFSQSGLYSNHQDIGPRYAGILLGLSNSAGVLAGVFGTYVTGQILQNGSWDEVFTVAVALYLVGTVVWNVFATGERVFD
ncbi:hypothetical protein CLOM_g9769 [Closterium sp. NIES-68]|nr:hypothetical protein CLOM_g9769 [Closterium sp. NIES-68]GJP76725.1 hypothetical protein CLOP_g7191 [Closterium sp. NIES-67]